MRIDMTKLHDIIKNRFLAIPKERILRASARLAPIVGASLAKLISTGETEKILQEICKISDEQSERLLKQLDILREEQYSGAPIVVVGSGNLELLLHSPSNERVILGEKHSVKVDSLWGGSGVNFTTRLLSVGRPVLPVLPIANDHAGKQIVQAMKKNAKEGDVLDDINTLWSEFSLFNSNVTTPTSVLVIHKSERTAFRQQAESSDGYLDQMMAQIDQIYSICNSPSALMIGHVPRGNTKPEEAAVVVDHLLEKYRNRTLIYAVFGSSQLRLGWKVWEKHIRENIDVFQLNLSEAKAFFSNKGKPATIEEILKHLMDMNVWAVITMDKFGAIAIHSGAKYIYVIWPLVKSIDVCDSTGAGDAFAAGMVSVLSDIGRGFIIHDFEQALSEGSRWAGAACLTRGGSGRSPGKELADFVDCNDHYKENNVETRKDRSLHEFLTLIDLAYQ